MPGKRPPIRPGLKRRVPGTRVTFPAMRRPETRARYRVHPMAGSGHLIEPIGRPTRTLPAVTRMLEAVKERSLTQELRAQAQTQGPGVVTRFFQAAKVVRIVDPVKRERITRQRAEDITAKLDASKQATDPETRLKLFQSACRSIGHLGEINRAEALIRALPKKHIIERAHAYVEVLEGIEESRLLTTKEKADLVRLIASGELERVANAAIRGSIQQLERDIKAYDREVEQSGHNPGIAPIETTNITLAACLNATPARYGLGPYRSRLLETFKFLSDHQLFVAARDVAALLGTTPVELVRELQDRK